VARPRLVTIRPATAADVDPITRLVDAAYHPYVDLIGTTPGPMLADYARLTADEQVEVAEVDGAIGGILVTEVTQDDFVIENVAVLPGLQGRGIGTTLLDHAEAAAAAAGHDSVRLYTHQLMTDNLARYRHRGYVEFATESLPDGRRLVHLRKELGDNPSK
jgi:ribosomal protein S18 acetylase RimI-like enzyme